MLPKLYPPPRPTAIEAIGDEPTLRHRPAPTVAVGIGYLEAIGARAVVGRLFTPRIFIEGAAPVTVVNEPFALEVSRRPPSDWPPDSYRIRAFDGEAGQPWREIIGVVPDLGLSVGDPALSAGFYMPVRDQTLYYLAIRTAGDPQKLVAPLRAAVANVDPDLQLEEIVALKTPAVPSARSSSGIASSLTAMGGMALLLSIVGIYALLSFMVTRRTREIGIRVALGAQNWQVLASITGGALLYLALGGVLGSALGIVFVRMRSMILIGIPAPGFWMPATIFLTLALAGGIACWLPARRALNIRPSEALSAD